jgi:hypothetical protein
MIKNLKKWPRPQKRAVEPETDSEMYNIYSDEPYAVEGLCRALTLTPYTK